MKYLIWHNQLTNRYNYGTQENFTALKQFYGEKIVFNEEFSNVSEEIIKRVTRSINKQHKKQPMAA